MNTSPIAIISFFYRDTHASLLKLVEDLSEDQLTWQPRPTANSIAFYVWHLARWADYIQATVPGMTPELGRRLGLGRQLWETEGLAAQWGLDPNTLGIEQAGWEMDPTAAGRMRLPAKDVLLDYACRAFGAAERAFEAIDDKQFKEFRQQEWASDGTVGHFVMLHFTHESNHLGMIEYLKGLKNLSA